MTCCAEGPVSVVNKTLAPWFHCLLELRGSSTTCCVTKLTASKHQHVLGIKLFNIIMFGMDIVGHGVPVLYCFINTWWSLHKFTWLMKWTPTRVFQLNPCAWSIKHYAALKKTCWPLCSVFPVDGKLWSRLSTIVSFWALKKKSLAVLYLAHGLKSTEFKFSFAAENAPCMKGSVK